MSGDLGLGPFSGTVSGFLGQNTMDSRALRAASSTGVWKYTSLQQSIPDTPWDWHIYLYILMVEQGVNLGIYKYSIRGVSWVLRFADAL